ncbi:Crp/Fnr family transcriptional regulator [Alicyclobacillus sp. SO9]|uniref:Crp/Fnr family transcriptional regulator n=1 Tax=Alicyclobacillus sp. SO9 TaxID=2665646 RepID=UPI0018E754FF|nr:Crp/Fnr family transcriptional regulator [Alicyclobacillus sp. SO9]QQE80997.1 Crp/Fnr family transcriptional regulator [Alicyclobacillus sp. SO9]
MDKWEVLRSIELFKELNDMQLESIEALTAEHTYERGEYVFMEGQTRESVYFVRKGLVKVFKVDEEGREQIVNIIGAKQMFPHVGFFDSSPYPGTAEALTSCTLFSIRSSSFENLLSDHPDIVQKVMKVMGKKILQLQAKLQELALYDAHQRIQALMSHFAEEHGREEDDGVHIQLPVTHADMAQMVGMSRESVNRILNQFRREGVLRGTREEWVINSDWLRN